MLQHVEQSEQPCYDVGTIETIKELLRRQIRALEEVAGDLASQPPELPKEGHGFLLVTCERSSRSVCGQIRPQTIDVQRLNGFWGRGSELLPGSSQEV